MRIGERIRIDIGKGDTAPIGDVVDIDALQSRTVVESASGDRGRVMQGYIFECGAVVKGTVKDGFGVYGDGCQGRGNVVGGGRFFLEAVPVIGLCDSGTAVVTRCAEYITERVLVGIVCGFSTVSNKGDGQSLQGGASEECIGAHRGNVVADCDVHQIRAVIEGSIGNVSARDRQGYERFGNVVGSRAPGRGAAAVIILRRGNGTDVIRSAEQVAQRVLVRAAFRFSFVSDKWNCEICQGITAVKSGSANGSNAVGQDYVGQPATARKRLVADGGNAVGDGDLCQGRTIGEGLFINGYNGIGEDDGCNKGLGGKGVCGNMGNLFAIGGDRRDVDHGIDAIADADDAARIFAVLRTVEEAFRILNVTAKGANALDVIMRKHGGCFLIGRIFTARAGLVIEISRLLAGGRVIVSCMMDDRVTEGGRAFRVCRVLATRAGIVSVVTRFRTGGGIVVARVVYEIVTEGVDFNVRGIAASVARCEIVMTALGASGGFCLAEIQIVAEGREKLHVLVDANGAVARAITTRGTRGFLREPRVEDMAIVWTVIFAIVGIADVG